MHKRYIYLFACFFCFLTAEAQLYPFVHYTPKDGLVNSRVRKAAQDSKGRMYFLTYSGLSVYDGARFRNYTMQNGLGNDLLNDVLEIGNDSILVATNACEIHLLINGELKQLKLVNDSCPIINQFLPMSAGGIYAATDNGLYQLRNNRLEKLPAFDPVTGEPLMYLGDITHTNDFFVFSTNNIRRNKGLMLYDRKQLRVTDMLREVTIADVNTDPSGIIWVSTQTGIFNIDTIALRAGKLVLRTPYNSNVQLTQGTVLFNRHNEMLVHSGHKGIVFFRKNAPPLSIASPEPVSNITQQAFIDRENILWICYDGNGVYKLPGTKLQSIQTLLPHINEPIRYALQLSPDSTLYVLQNNKWIIQSGSASRIVEPYPSFQVTPILQNGSRIYSINTTNLYSTDLSSSQQQKGILKKLITIPDTASFGIKAVVDPHGNILINEKRGIYAIKDDRPFYSLPLSFYDLVEGLYVSNNKELWVISRSLGLQVFTFHPENPEAYLQRNRQFLKEFGEASPRCMVVDKNERLWVGTRFHGVMAFEVKDNQLVKLFHFRTQNGLTDNYVTSLACDNDKNIIVGTQTGLDRLLSRPDGEYLPENITKSNNIFSYILQVWTDNNNNAYGLTNAGGLLQVNPVQPPSEGLSPILLLQEIKVNGQLVHENDLRTLRYDQRNISINLAAPTFIDEKQVQFSYRLAGDGNNEWSEPGHNANISLLNLSPGKYLLEVKAFFPSTSYAPQYASYAFEILPPWWNTWWFRISAIVLLLLIILFALRSYYRRKLEKQAVVMERQKAIEKERTRIATDMHDDLGAGLSRIKFLSETIGIKKQQQLPIEEDINSIREYSHEMIDKMGEIVWALNEKNDSLSDLLAYTRSYTVEYLSQHGIKSIIEVPDYFPSTFVSGEFRRNIYLSVKEALHNIVKHAQAQQVKMSIAITNNLAITIGDDGIGFTEQDIQPYSNGLSNMKNRMQDIGGQLEINRGPGTIIKLIAPVP